MPGRDGGSRFMALVWLGALAIAFAGFYGLDLLVMGAQGLPLNWDLTPAR